MLSGPVLYAVTEEQNKFKSDRLIRRYKNSLTLRMGTLSSESVLGTISYRCPLWIALGIYSLHCQELDTD